MTTRRDRAFTLVELIIALLLGAIVMSAVFYGVSYFFGQISRAKQRSQLHDEADIASRWIEQRTREATWAYLESSTADSVVAEQYRNGTFQWANDIYANSPSLMVNTGDETKKVASNLQSVTFSVYPNRLAYTLRMRRNEVVYRMESSVRLRNPSYSGIWHFTGASGRVAYDESAKRNHALIKGCQQVNPSGGWEYGPALSFRGSVEGDHLKVPANPGLDTEDQVSISAWVRLSSTAAGDMGSGGTTTLSVMNRNGEGVKPGGFLHVYLESGELCFAFCDNDVQNVVRVYSDTVSWTADRWYQILVQYNDRGTQWVRLYRDGDLIGKENVEEMHPVTAGDLLIGAYRSGGTLRGMWKGEMDEVRYSTF